MKNTQRFDELWNDFFSSKLISSPSTGYYSEKLEDHYLLEIPVPGLTKSDLTIKMVDGKLEISGGVKEHRWTPMFEKTFILPKNTSTKKTQAVVENGILSIKLGINKDSETIVKIL